MMSPHLCWILALLLGACNSGGNPIDKTPLTQPREENNFPQDTVKQELVQLLCHSMVKITIQAENSEKMSQQTGFLLALDESRFSSFLLISAAHGLGAKNAVIQVETMGMQKTLSSRHLLLIDAENDFAILELERAWFAIPPRPFQVCLNPEAYLFEEVFTAGFSQSYATPGLSQGLLSSVSRAVPKPGREDHSQHKNFFEVSGATTCNGHSGAPIFTMQNRDGHCLPIAIGVASIQHNQLSLISGCLTALIQEKYLHWKTSREEK